MKKLLLLLALCLPAFATPVNYDTVNCHALRVTRTKGTQPGTAKFDALGQMWSASRDTADTVTSLLEWARIHGAPAIPAALDSAPVAHHSDNAGNADSLNHYLGSTYLRSISGLTADSSKDAGKWGGHNINNTGGVFYNGSSARAFGDSYTQGYNSSDTTKYSFVHRLMTDMGWTVWNYGLGGAQVADLASTIYSITPNPSDVSIWYIGYNDMRIYLDYSRLRIYQNGMLSECAWLALDSGESKIAATSGRMTYTAGWSYSGAYPITWYSHTNGSTASCKVRGKCVFVDHIINNGDAGNFSVTIDGINQGTFYTSPSYIGTVTTDLSTTYAPELLYFPNLGDSLHTVTLTVTSSSGYIYLNWIAGVGGQENLSAQGPRVYVGNIARIPHAGYISNGGGSDSWVDVYNKIINENVNLLASLGLHIALADIHSALNTTTCFSSDSIHPNDTGHARIASAFEYVMNDYLYPHNRQLATQPIINIQNTPRTLNLYVDSLAYWIKRALLDSSGTTIYGGRFYSPGDPTILSVGTSNTVGAFLGGYYTAGASKSTIYFGENVYFDGAWRYPNAVGNTALYLMQNGNYYWYTGTTTIGTYKMNLSNAGVLGINSIVPNSGTQIFMGSGANGKIIYNPDFSVYGDVPAGAWVGSSGSGSYSFLPSGDLGTVGAKVVVCYFNGSAFKSALEVANVSSGTSNLLLMKGGGGVGVGMTPTMNFEIAHTSSGAASHDIVEQLNSTYVSGESGPLLSFKASVVTGGAIGGVSLTGGYPGALLFYAHNATADNTIGSGLTECMRLTSTVLTLTDSEFVNGYGIYTTHGYKCLTISNLDTTVFAKGISAPAATIPKLYGLTTMNDSLCLLNKGIQAPSVTASNINATTYFYARNAASSWLFGDYAGGAGVLHNAFLIWNTNNTSYFSVDTLGGMHINNYTSIHANFTGSNLLEIINSNTSYGSLITFPGGSVGDYGSGYAAWSGNNGNIAPASMTGLMGSSAGLFLSTYSGGNIYITPYATTTPAVTVRPDSIMFNEPIVSGVSGNLSLTGTSSVYINYKTTQIASFGYGGTGINFPTLSPVSGVDILTIGNSSGNLSHTTIAAGTIPMGSTSIGLTPSVLTQDASNVVITGRNVGIGGTPSTWLSTWTALHIGTTAAFAGLNGTPGVGGVNIVANNAYLDPAAGGTWKRITGTDYASLYQQYEGSHSFQYAASGVAGSAISWLTAMTITNGGLVGIDCTPTSTLHVAGPIALQPMTIAGNNYTVLPTDAVITTTYGQTWNVTLPAAASYHGRVLHIVSTQGSYQAVTSVSSNVIPPGSTTPGTAIYSGSGAYDWAMLQSVSLDGGTNWYWQIIARGL